METPSKGLTLAGPWLQIALITGRVVVGWNTDYRGPILITESKKKISPAEFICRWSVKTAQAVSSFLLENDGSWSIKPGRAIAFAQIESCEPFTENSGDFFLIKPTKTTHLLKFREIIPVKDRRRLAGKPRLWDLDPRIAQKMM